MRDLFQVSESECLASKWAWRQLHCRPRQAPKQQAPTVNPEPYKPKTSLTAGTLELSNFTQEPGSLYHSARGSRGELAPLPVSELGKARRLKSGLRNPSSKMISSCQHPPIVPVIYSKDHGRVSTPYTPLPLLKVLRRLYKARNFELQGFLGCEVILGSRRLQNLLIHEHTLILIIMI